MKFSCKRKFLLVKGFLIGKPFLLLLRMIPLKHEDAKYHKELYFVFPARKFMTPQRTEPYNLSSIWCLERKNLITLL